MPTRTEKDTFGPIQVPSERLWGAQTQRSLQNFDISGERQPREIIRALVQVKRSSAVANHLAMTYPDLFARVAVFSPGCCGDTDLVENLRWLPVFLADNSADPNVGDDFADITNQASVPIDFTNKSNVIVNTQAGDDFIVLNNPTRSTGMIMISGVGGVATPIRGSTGGGATSPPRTRTSPSSPR